MRELGHGGVSDSKLWALAKEHQASQLTFCLTPSSRIRGSEAGRRGYPPAGGAGWASGAESTVRRQPSRTSAASTLCDTNGVR